MAEAVSTLAHQPASPALMALHPLVRHWFEQNIGVPTPPQEAAWPHLLAHKDVLVAAPTGSGKTLAAFLCAMSDLVTDAAAGTLRNEVRVVYVSPLKALSNDIHKNLLVPLSALSEVLAKDRGVVVDNDASEPAQVTLRDSVLRAAVRTGDTPQAERARINKKPPHVLVTTPESLYVLLGSKSGRKLLSTATTLIWDEIHAVIGTRRGAHLALSVERLERACGHRVQRIGLSATQKPVVDVARYLVGTHNCEADGTPHCEIIDHGHLRQVDVAIEIPRSPLAAVMSTEVQKEVFGRIAELVLAHKTTLVFVNTRRMAERVAAQLEVILTPHLGADAVCAHHGSMSKDKRLAAEERLKSGALRVLVATASLELGIDVGSVDLVCQLGVTKTIAALLQRVGRANHNTRGIPKGRLFPMSRDELIESVALVDAIRARDLDCIIMQKGGLDVLAQHIVAAAADDDLAIDDLKATVRRAWAYRDLSDKDFDDALTLVHEGVATHRGRRGAHVFVDKSDNRVRGRKGARLAALMSGGAIPDLGDYTVVEEPQGTVVGTINEDFAIDSSPGDIFQLGTTSWRILRVERGTVRVEDAKGQPPSLPFWFGEAPARSRELSLRINTLREEVNALLADGHDAISVEAHLIRTRDLHPAAAKQMAEYLCATHQALGILPTQQCIVFERFHDDLGGAQIVVHAPFGSRVMRAWGLALRKRFCRTFDFELQAAATEDALLLSVGAVEDVDLTALPYFLNEKTARNVLVQAVLDAPIFGTRFRWNATRALTVLRMRSGKRVPPGLLRIEAEDVLLSLFPQQAACLENIVGDREVPDDVLVRQTVHDCLTEAMDIEALEAIFLAMRNKTIEVRCVESVLPSPLAHEVIAAKPYAFLDDAPLEERRVQAVFVPRGLDGQGAPLDPGLVYDALSEVHPDVNSADEAHDALLLTGFLYDDELAQVCGARMPGLVHELVDKQRAVRHLLDGKAAYAAVERHSWLLQRGQDPDALYALLRARLEVHGPQTDARMASMLAVSPEHFQAVCERALKLGEALRCDVALAAAPAVRGPITVGTGLLWSKRLVVRVRRRMLDRLRAQIEPVHAGDLMRFLFRHHRMDAPNSDANATRTAVALLSGAVVGAGAWEDEVLPVRVKNYRPAMLDALCFSGEVAWKRPQKKKTAQLPEDEDETTPVASRKNRTLRTSPLLVMLREHEDVLVDTTIEAASDSSIEAELSTHARAVLSVLKARGASFAAELARAARLLPEPCEEALAELIQQGLVTADGFAGVRALMLSAKDKERVRKMSHRRPGAHALSLERAGRFALASAPVLPDGLDVEKQAERQARLLLVRFGIVFKALVERTEGLLPWRDVLYALRRLEARGDVRGGRFVVGISGEQFALNGTIAALREARSKNRDPKQVLRVVTGACDPLNLTGHVLPGARVPAVLSHRILWENGNVVAVRDGKGTRLVAPTTLTLPAAEALLIKKLGTMIETDVETDVEPGVEPQVETPSPAQVLLPAASTALTYS